MILAVVSGLAAAFCFALATTMQETAAKRQRPRQPWDPRLLLCLLRSSLWRAGWLPDTAGAALQAVALRFGPLAIVQPLLASGLFMAILIEAAWSRRRVQRRDLAATAIGTAGLATFLVTADVRAGVQEPTAASWWGIAVGAGVAVAACVAGSRWTTGAGRGALLGVAAGVLYGVAAALLKAVATRFHGDLLALVVDPRLLALILVLLSGLLLNQNAFQSGRIAAPLTALTLSDPVSSVVIGVTAFREVLSLTGPRIAVVVVAVAAIGLGVWLAGSAPAIPRRIDKGGSSP